MERIEPIRAIAAGILGVFMASLAVFVLFRLIGFQYWGIILDPELQSPKLIKVWAEIEPIPLTVNRPGIPSEGMVIARVYGD